MAKSYKKRAIDYAKNVCAGKIIAGHEVILACARFLKDLERDDLTLRSKDPDFLIGIIERLMVHQQGETIDGEPLKNKPLLLQDWQIFICYNLVGFYWKGTKKRRFNEAFIFIPRKNGKTPTACPSRYWLKTTRTESSWIINALRPEELITSMTRQKTVPDAAARKISSENKLCIFSHN